MAESKRVIGVGELCVSNQPGDLLITYALGSCLGVTFYDPELRMGGLAHCQLPMRKGTEPRDEGRPAMYVDTGIAHLFSSLTELGACKRRLQVKVAGGCHPGDGPDLFQIGERNLTVLRKLLWKNNLLIAAADVGGSQPRTMSLETSTGRVLLSSAGQSWEL